MSQTRRAGPQDVFQVDRVGQVDTRRDVHDALDAGPGQVHGRVSILGSSGGPSLGLLGVEPGLRLLDQPGQDHRPDLVRDRRQLGVSEVPRASATENTVRQAVPTTQPGQVA